jgi:hypothetical protein
MSKNNPKQKRRARQNRHFRIDQELSVEDRKAYQAYLMEPRTTNKSAHAWLAQKGYSFSESAVARHMRHFLEGHDQQRETERFALRVAEMAGAVKWATVSFAARCCGPIS